MSDTASARPGGAKGTPPGCSRGGKAYAQANLKIDRLLVTWDPTNAASARVIEKRGGVLEDESFYGPAGHLVRRSWIAL